MRVSIQEYIKLFFRPVPRWEEAAAVVVAIINFLVWAGIGGSVIAAVTFQSPTTRWLTGAVVISSSAALLAIWAGLRLQSRVIDKTNRKERIQTINDLITKGSTYQARISLNDKPLYTGPWPTPSPLQFNPEHFSALAQEALDWMLTVHTWTKQMMPEWVGVIGNISPLVMAEQYAQPLALSDWKLVYNALISDIQTKLERMVMFIIEQRPSTN